MASESRARPDSDLSWLAFRYVAGEMDRDEAEAFESRLDQDQSAREAVAEAVALAGAIARLEPATSRPSSPHCRSPPCAAGSGRSRGAWPSASPRRPVWPG